MNKTKNLDSLKKIVKKLKIQGKIIVFTNGCYDLIHPGHIKIFHDAKKKGDILIVAVNSDSSIRKIKGKGRPIMDEKARTTILQNLTVIDYVILFSQPTPYQLIKELEPDVLVKGGDWKKTDIIGSDIIKKIYRVKLLPGYSTTKIINRIRENA